MIRIITNERAYVLGLLVGAGTIANSTFSITVPLDKWGASPNISNGVAVDILTKIRKLFSDAYGVEITYELGNKGKWSIKPIEKFNCVEIIDDLNSLSLPFSGVLLSNNEQNTSRFRTGICVYTPGNGIDWVDTKKVNGISSWEDLRSVITI